MKYGIPKRDLLHQITIIKIVNVFKKEYYIFLSIIFECLGRDPFNNLKTQCNYRLRKGRIIIQLLSKGL